MIPSASRAALLLQCSRPFDSTLQLPSDPPGEPARWGSAWHEVGAHVLRLQDPKMPRTKELHRLAAKAAKHYDVEGGTDELLAHFTQNFPEMLRHYALWKPTKKEIEVSLAYDPFSDTARRIAPPTEDDHHYECSEREHPMTVDWAFDTAKYLIIGDHKTGMGDFSKPWELAQLRSLALGFRALYRSKKPILVAVNHAFRRGIAKVYYDELSTEDMTKHREGLKEGISRIGDGSLRPGRECAGCPARGLCPAGDSGLLDRADALLRGTNVLGSSLVLTSNDQTDLTRERRLGLLYETIEAGVALASRAREAIKDEIRNQSVLPELSDGRRLVIKTRSVERLSKKAYVDVYGKLGAERVFSRLRKDGVLMKKEEEYLTKDD